MKGYLLWSDQDQKGIAVDLYSNTWRNPANAQYKRQKLYFNILPRVSDLQLCQRRVAADDWDIKTHRRLSRAIERAKREGQGWAWFDNRVKRGYTLYLTDAPGLAGFEPVVEVRRVLIDTLKSIRPPGPEETGRFHLYGGSQNWVGKADDTGEEDKDHWQTIAVSQGPTDFIGLEAECVVAGVETKFTRPYWRGQPYEGLEMRHASREALVSAAGEPLS